MSASESRKTRQLFITLIAILICAVILAITQAIKGTKVNNSNTSLNSHVNLDLSFPDQRTSSNSNANISINTN